MMKAKYLIKIDGDNITFSNLNKVKHLKPFIIKWKCEKCSSEIDHMIDDDAPNHCYYCETR